jgi:hypothetical protein
MAKKRYRAEDHSASFDEEQIEEIARQLDVKPEQVRETIIFTTIIRREIEEHDLSFHQSIAGLMSVVAALLRDTLPDVARGDACTDIYHNLWGACGLSTDREFKEMKYEFTKNDIN